MKKLLSLLACLLLVLSQTAAALAEVTEAEQDQYYYWMEDLVYGIGNRNVAIEGSERALQYLIAEYQALGGDFADGTLQLCPVEGTTYWGFDIHSSDVIGVRRAVNENPNIIVFSAHYDSIAGPGARDNASGVAAVLLLLQRFSQREPFADTEFRFIAFTAEETGHQGSQAYVASLPQEERDRIVAVFNMDMIVVDDWQEEDFSLTCDTLGGRTAGGYVSGDEEREDAPVQNAASRAFLQAIADLNAFDPSDAGDRYAVRCKGDSDHDSFHAAGIDAVSISFRGKPGTDGMWSTLMHSENDLIGEFDWDATWTALDILYTAAAGLAGDAAYGSGME